MSTEQNLTPQVVAQVAAQVAKTTNANTNIPVTVTGTVEVGGVNVPAVFQTSTRSTTPSAVQVNVGQNFKLETLTRTVEQIARASRLESGIPVTVLGTLEVGGVATPIQMTMRAGSTQPSEIRVSTEQNLTPATIQGMVLQILQDVRFDASTTINVNGVMTIEDATVSVRVVTNSAGQIQSAYVLQGVGAANVTRNLMNGIATLLGISPDTITTEQIADTETNVLAMTPTPNVIDAISLTSNLNITHMGAMGMLSMSGLAPTQTAMSSQVPALIASAVTSQMLNQNAAVDLLALMNQGAITPAQAVSLTGLLELVGVQMAGSGKSDIRLDADFVEAFVKGAYGPSVVQKLSQQDIANVLSAAPAIMKAGRSKNFITPVAREQALQQLNQLKTSLAQMDAKKTDGVMTQETAFATAEAAAASIVTNYLKELKSAGAARTLIGIAVDQSIADQNPAHLAKLVERANRINGAFGTAVVVSTYTGGPAGVRHSFRAFEKGSIGITVLTTSEGRREFAGDNEFNIVEYDAARQQSFSAVLMYAISNTLKISMQEKALLEQFIKTGNMGTGFRGTGTLGTVSENASSDDMGDMIDKALEAETHY